MSDREPEMITEVGWRTECEISPETFQFDMAFAEREDFHVHEWNGRDPEGRFLSVTWVVTPGGALVAAYARQGRPLGTESPLTRPVPQYSGEGAIYTPEYLRRREGNDRGAEAGFWRVMYA